MYLASSFTLTILWSYLNFPAKAHSVDLSYYSKSETGPVDGLEWWQVYNELTDFNAMYANEFFAKYGPNGPKP